jgi:hypothetical protein
VVDFALVEGRADVSRALADRALTRLGVDIWGLDGADRRYLTLLAENYGGGPVGVETIAAALSEPRDAIEEVIEPYLLQQGLIQRTPRGRMLGAKAWRHLGLEAPTIRPAARPMRRGRLVMRRIRRCIPCCRQGCGGPARFFRQGGGPGGEPGAVLPRTLPPGAAPPAPCLGICAGGPAG